jgi:pimeloyl-ACP methyl ester carboxylesterase
MSGMRDGLHRVLFLTLLSAFLVAGCAGGSGGSGGVPTSAAPAPAAACLAEDEVRTGQVSFPSGDGSTLQGLVIGTGPVGIVLAHQSGADLCQWKPYAYALSRQGYRVLVFNFSAHLPEDVTGAVAALRARGSQSVVLIGASMGANAVVAAAATVKPPVAAVVSLSAPQVFQGVDASQAAPKLTMPVLYVAGASDGDFAQDARTLYAATKAPGRQLLIVKSGAHGVELMNETVTAVMEKFVRAHAAAGSTPAPS